MSLGLKYWYKSQLNSLYIDVTNYVTEQVRGSNSINEMPSNFEFTLSVPKNGSDYIEVVSGDEIAITFDETCTSLLIHGNIIDSGIDIISFDRLRNKPFYKYNIICSQKDFSNTIIDTLDYTDTNLSVILDELMNYSDESIGSPYLSKYAVNFADYQISSFSVEKKTVREALTDLCQQIDCFWKLSYIVSPDNVNTLFVNRYIEISNKNGIMPTSSSIWQNGITTSIVKNGVISNPIIGNTSILANVVAETELKIKQDTSVICNSVELIGKIFTNNDSNSLYRYDFRAEPSKFEYILNGYASDIVYVAFQLKDPKDPVRIMSGSTTTVIKIPSRYAVGIEVGNKAYFQNDDTINFYPIDTVTKIDIYYTEIGFSTPLPFTIVEGHSFEIASNVTIYEEKYNLNYSQKGVVKYVNKDTEARIKFLDLSEPPPGVFVTVFYKKIQDYKIKFQNDVSKKLFGLKYKEIKLDDDIVLTQLEMDNLSSNLLVLEPKLTFSVNSKRYGLAPVGMNIPVVVNGFLNQNFILQNNSWEYLGKDPQKQHVFNQDLDFSNIINNPENFIKSLKKRKATKTTQLNTKDIMKELLNITENISYSTALVPPRDFVTNSNTLFYYKVQDGSGSVLNDDTVNNIDGSVIGSPNWQSGVISGDSSSLQITGSSNYIATPNYSTQIVDFTIRHSFKFETGDKTAKSFHDFFAKYDGYLNEADGNCILLEYLVSTNDLYFFVFDDTHTIASPKYRYFVVNFNLLENVNYLIQASFKLVDPSNSNLNTFEISINGVKRTGTLYDYGVSNISTVNNRNIPFYIGATRGYDVSFNYAQFKLMRAAFDNEFRTEAEALTDYNNLFIRDLITDSFDLFYFRNKNGSGSVITDELLLNNGSIIGSPDWQSGVILGDSYSLQLDGSTNYITTPSDSTNFINFTIRKALRFETGNKAAKSFHPIIGKYDYYFASGVNGWNFISEFLPSSNKIILYVFDDTSVLGSLKYRTYEVTYNLLENVDYILQIAFKLDDPSNSHLNTAEICVNGVKISGSWTDYGISNITTIKNQTQEIKIGAERGTGSTHDVAKFKSLRSALSTRFRTEAEALDDYNNLFT